MDIQTVSLPRIGDPAPDFEANSTFGPIRFSQYRGRWVLLFSHPADFTPVCSTEIMALARRAPEFEQRGVQLIGLSVDSVPAHLAWTRNLAAHLGHPVPFPIIADLDMTVSRRYGMLHPGESTTATVRSVFFIDPEGVIRALVYYPLSTGRNIDELLRVVDSLQVTASHSVSTPVDWRPGQPVVVPAPATQQAIETPDDARQMGLEYQEWYLRFKTIE
ncbi:3-Cys thioredoxin peroxidase (plasmid) [Sulfobacillus acidophilus DSM 10332]|uniref:Peroxiredoxin n=1 Tax=Sulfobacillus acidophilus (strain ATCC 700253 / DSM 10332 / NAL) TaxID=679936 RepID=G8U1S0_SULAD|nr:3-Cys thioredoxin peroxidase [Sulfobacillus acidophilus DSM 10332]